MFSFKVKLFFILFFCVILGMYIHSEAASARNAGPRGFKKMVGSFTGGTSCIVSTFEWILVAKKDSKEVVVLNPEDGSSIGILKGHTAPVEAIAVSPANDYAATTDDKGLEILLWDFKKFTSLKSITSTIQVTALAFGSQGKILAAGDKDGSVSIFDLTSGEEVKKLSIPEKAIAGILKEPPGKILELKVSPTGQYVAAREKHGSLLVWDLNDNAKANIHIVPPNKIWSLQFSVNGRYLLAAGGTYSLKIQFSKKKGEYTCLKSGRCHFCTGHDGRKNLFTVESGNGH